MKAAIKRGAVIWCIAGALLLAWSGGARTYNSTQNSDRSGAIAQADRSEHFYRIVAGQLSGDEGPGDKLARDLRDLPEDQLTTFEGDSNKYGGITGDLGFDPFAEGDNCPECGRLDEDVETSVLRIKHGDLDNVVVALHANVPDAKHQGGPPFAIWLAWVLWLPLYTVFIYIRNRKGEELKWREMAQEHNLVGELRKAQQELPERSEQWMTLNNLANELEDQMAKRLQYKDTKSRAMRLEYLTNEASETLDALKAGTKELN